MRRPGPASPALGTLAIVTLFIAMVSEIFVGSVQEAGQAWGCPGRSWGSSWSRWSVLRPR